MPKMKTKKSVSKRFKVTGSGKVRRAKSGRRHLLSHKTSKRKRNLRAGGLVDSTDMNRLRVTMPYKMK